MSKKPKRKEGEGEMEAGAAAGSSSSTAKVNLIKQIRSHEIALAELNSISSSSRFVYQKNGNIFFHTTIQKAVASEQKQLDSTKSMLEKLNNS